MTTSTSSFPRAHAATALKYAGISFIAGAVNHGFFSGTRSLITAAIGMVAFVLGTWLEHDHEQAESKRTLMRQIGIGALFSIGLGFFTGGLQHFPDSPARSAWVVPLGFVVSIFAMLHLQDLRWCKRTAVYALIASGLVIGGSWAAYRYYESHAHSHASSAIGVAGDKQAVSRTIELDMNDTMRFHQHDIEVTQGETIRFVVKNSGQLPHEFVLGTREDLAAHAKEMAQHAAAGHHMAHDEPNMISVDPGKTGEVVWQFTQAGVVDFACLVPGHFEAGMKGRVVVRGNPAVSSGGHSH
jgi:uncharacterized cupredoxin-like copper-binding protein